MIQLSRLLAGRRIAAVAAMLVGAGALAIFDRDGSDTRHPFDDDPVRALAEIGQKLEAADGGSSSLAPNRPTTALPQHSLLSRGYSPIGDGPTVPAAGQPISGLASVEEMTERLARRLEATPTDIEGWRMLGWSYAAIDRHADSARAYARADAIARTQQAATADPGASRPSTPIP